MEKVEETIKKIELAIEKAKNKQGKIIFLCQDTRGAAKASVAYMYRMAKTLGDDGYEVNILHEKNDYTKVGSWLGEEFDSMVHKSIEDNDLVVGPQDIIVVPEIYGNVFEQIMNLPIEKVLLVQNYEYLLSSFSPGKSWIDFDVAQCITISKNLQDAIMDLVPVGNVDFVEPYVEDYFSPSELPNQPVVAIHARETNKAAKVIKSFYLKYPLYRFISFKDMHGMTERDFAKNLKECALAVWMDDDSSFGTFPLEAMKCNVPVIGKVPNLLPEWMDDDNGMWVYDENQICDLVSNYMKNWLEDNVPDNLSEVSEKIKNKYSKENFVSSTLDLFKSIFERKIVKLEATKKSFVDKENQ